MRGEGDGRGCVAVAWACVSLRLTGLISTRELNQFASTGALGDVAVAAATPFSNRLDRVYVWRDVLVCSCHRGRAVRAIFFSICDLPCEHCVPSSYPRLSHAAGCTSIPRDTPLLRQHPP
jgi:hypothetical protein